MRRESVHVSLRPQTCCPVMKPLAYTLLLTLCSGAWAETSSQHSSGTCHGVLTASLASGQTHPRLGECLPALVPEFAAAIRAAGTRTDTAYLGTLLEYAHIIRDPHVFEAGAALAVAGGATPAARVTGLVIAVTQHDPRLEFRGPSLGNLFSVPMSETCSEVEFSHLEPPLPGHGMMRPIANGVPANAEARLRVISEQLKSASVPTLVRRLARCVSLVLPQAPAAPVSADAVTLSYDCTNDEFLVRNRSDAEIEVRWRVEGTAGEGYLVLPPHGTRDFWVEDVGPVVLFAGQTAVARITPDRTNCPTQ